MKNLTKKQAIEEHRKMWNWIADECLIQKRVVNKGDYFDYLALPISERPQSNCWCCEYVKHTNDDIEKLICEVECPIKWYNDGTFYYYTCIDYRGKSPYIKYLKATNYETASYFAREIANLPERTDMSDENTK